MVLNVLAVLVLAALVTSEARRESEAADYRRTYGVDLGQEIHPNRLTNILFNEVDLKEQLVYGIEHLKDYFMHGLEAGCVF